jgi:3-hydroxyisobutyrate dehydrogenase
MAAGFSPPERIGFVGLGNMGAPMATRLAQAGYTLVVADSAADTLARFSAAVRCQTAAQPREFEACGVLITMLPDGHSVRRVVLGDGGIAASLPAGAVVIDMSSSSPVGTRALAAELSHLGIHFVDAPVSGGVRKALDGSLAIMAGGELATVERCRPLLEVLGRVFATGPAGSGHAMKALNNYLSAANLAVAAEAIIAGERFGLDPATMVSILNASTGRNSATEQKFPAYVLPRNFASGFAIGLMAKDLRLALEVARATGAPSTLLESCAQLWSDAERQLGFRADNTAVVRYLELSAARGTDADD